ncbi:MAG: hypothetical protein IJY42_05410 [Clostridia bacterium]|nr:hypothetical protein [Clostridia bacterium]
MNTSVLLSAPHYAEIPLYLELWYYFLDTYWSPQLYYDRLGMTPQDYVLLRNIVLGLCIGLALSFLWAAFHKRVLGAAVRALIARECLSPDRAVTLSELGLTNPLVRRLLRNNVSIRRVVRCREEDSFWEDVEQKRMAYEEANPGSRKPFREPTYRASDGDHYYVPEELKHMADIKFEAKGNSWPLACLMVVLCAVLFFALLFAMPHALKWLNGLLPV